MTALFTVGNFVTLGISLLFIFIIRYMDRQSRSVNLAREYGRRLKDEIAAFTEEKAAEVKDNVIILDVQKNAVKEALGRLSQASAELEEKTQGVMLRLEEVVRIGERISAYDKSMEDLIRMTGKVEEHMGRLKEESAFVEAAAKKIEMVMTRAEELENDMDGMEIRFERENTAALEKAVETVTFHVEDRMKEIRSAEQSLDAALEKAENRADKLEEEALAKYREEALIRINQFQNTVEEKFREYHENAKVRVTEIQALVRSNKDELKNSQAQMEEEQKEYRKSWQRDIEALDALAVSQRKHWEEAVEKTEERLILLGKEIGAKSIEAEAHILKEVEERLAGYKTEQSAHWKRFETLADDALKLDSQLRLSMEAAEAKVRKDFTIFEEAHKQEQERSAAALAEKSDALKEQMTALEQEFNVLKQRAYDNVEEKLQVFEDEFFAGLAKRSDDIDGRLNEWHSALEQKLSDKAEAVENKIQNDLDETENRISGLFGSAEEIRRGLKEFNSQTQLFEKTDELKISLERNMESLKSALSEIEDRYAETSRLETEFVKIRRLEDEVNTKMTRFLTEKNHLDIMEKDFEKLIQTSLRVEERLKEVTNADDTLQNIQVALRKLEDAIVAAEDKFQRVEKKNAVMEETNRGIERNFQIMEETELALRKCRENIDKAEEDLDSFRPSIENLAAASEKARETEEKLAILDTGITEIEKRMEKVQVAREWLARAETRFEELNKEAQEQLKLLEAVFREESKKSGTSKGAPPTAVRENIIRLARQGWQTEEIARNLKISRGEVELILEMGGKS